MDNNKIATIRFVEKSIIRIMYDSKDLDLKITSGGNVLITEKTKDCYETNMRLNNDLIENANNVKDVIIQRKKDLVEILMKIGIRVHLCGYHYILEALMWMIETNNPTPSLSKEVYVYLSDKMNVGVFKLERGIRNAINDTWEKNINDFKDKLFDFRPGNLEFLTMIYQYYINDVK